MAVEIGCVRTETVVRCGSGFLTRVDVACRLKRVTLDRKTQIHHATADRPEQLRSDEHAGTKPTFEHL